VPNTCNLGGDIEAANAPLIGFMDLLGVPTSDGVAYCGAPLYHGGPLVFGLVPHMLGSQLVLRRKWDAEEMLGLIEQDSVTTVYAVPTHFTPLLELPTGKLPERELRARYWEGTGRII
jgi:acyl-CoA synthetase (AMP-forming)/AMP-acid ligase II